MNSPRDRVTTRLPLLLAAVAGAAGLFAWLAASRPAADAAPGASSDPGDVSRFPHNSQPSLARDAKGRLWLAWNAWEPGKGETVLAAHSDDGKTLSPALAATDAPSDCFRPRLQLDGDGTLWLVWASNRGGNVDLYARPVAGDGLGAERRITDAPGPDYNHELCRDAKGRLWVVWQGYRDGAYRILARVHDKEGPSTGLGAGWKPEVQVSTGTLNQWDPVCVGDSKGSVHVAWSAFDAPGYSLRLRTLVDDKPAGDPAILRARLGYALHPWLAVDGGDRVWIAWDSINIPGHGSSDHGMHIAGSKYQVPEHIMEVAMWDGKTFRQPVAAKVGEAEAGTVPTAAPKYVWGIFNAGLPRIAWDPKAGLRLFYIAPQKPDQNSRGSFFWHVAGQSFDGKKWIAPRRAQGLTGYLEEADVLLDGDHAWCAWQKELSSPGAAGAKKADKNADPHDVEPRIPAQEKELRDHFGDAEYWSLGGNTSIEIARVALDATTWSEPSLVPVDDARTKPSSSSPAPLERYTSETGGEKRPLLWGDLHRHSSISRCHCGLDPTLEDHHKFAHDICEYDFTAMTDHAEHTTEYKYWRTEKAADLHHLPGSFVTMFGYEWSSKKYGHKNVISPDRGVPLANSQDPATETPDQLWKLLGNLKAVTIPHHPAEKAFPADWSYHNDRFQRLFEIASGHWGAYEYAGCPKENPNKHIPGTFGQDALAQGHKMGFVCASDHGVSPHYAGVYAKSLDRQSIFQALYDRRCFGATVRGLVLDVNADGHPMGSEYVNAGPRKLAVHVEGLAPLKVVEVFSEAKVVHAFPLKEGEKTLDASWEDATPLMGTRYYYVRVQQVDGEVAWGSPVWVSEK